MYEHYEVPPEQSAAMQRGAIDVDDFVFAATGARVRRLTTPQGEHWFPAVDAARHLGYSNTRHALRLHVSPSLQKSLSEIAQGVATSDTLSKLAAHRLQRSVKLVNLQGLIQLVNGCTKPECEPFKLWVSEVIVTIQRDGSYSLEPAPVQPAPTGGTAYAMPREVADAIVRLEERNIRADEVFAEALAGRVRLKDEQVRLQSEQVRLQSEQVRLRTEEIRLHGEHLRLRTENTRLQTENTRLQSSMADALHRIAHTLDRLADRIEAPGRRDEGIPAVTAQQLLATWRARNLVVTDDVHAVAAYLAPALVRGEARCRVEDVAERTGLTVERVVDCVRMLLKRGCMRQSGCGEDGTPVYLLP
ncbi:Bro-N domain-containing protein [Streptomyces sp. NPDC006458]|uniref:BRO-N domain-containing protein n=1 Tax=Streptomyces sp. NPDC006458 TaxID=3154302 RepID=UPI0033B1D9E9